ncbi:MAG: tRNA pseudouridine(38-40) synthase TruA [Bacteroidetes bacterium]|nr:tRNA pseudouridine(38-40) synthase TruA [Bacteroidota bacterium]
MQRYFFRLSFKGTRYHGWQSQPNAISVQGTLEKAFTTLLRTSIKITGAGRTDAGVHARNYVAHADIPESVLELPGQAFLYHLNAILPEDIVVHDLLKVVPDAHARFSAVSRTYRYYLSRQKDPFLRDFICFYPFPLDIHAMNSAGSMICSIQDFTSFAKVGSDARTSICRVSCAEWNEDGDLLVFTMKADRFLRNMVRSVVGTMLDVGRGKIQPADIIAISQLQNRGEAGDSVPAAGLTLEEVAYPPEIFL